MDKPLKAVTHGQCDVRPTVTFPAAGHHRPLDRYQNMLLSDRGNFGEERFPRLERGNFPLYEACMQRWLAGHTQRRAHLAVQQYCRRLGRLAWQCPHSMESWKTVTIGKIRKTVRRTTAADYKTARTCS